MVSDLHTGLDHQRVRAGCLLSLVLLVSSGCASSGALSTRATTASLAGGAEAILFLNDAAAGPPAVARVRANTAGDVVPVDVPDVAGDVRVNDGPAAESVSGAARVGVTGPSPDQPRSREFGRIFMRLKAALDKNETRSIVSPPPLPKRDHPDSRKHSLFSEPIDPTGRVRTRPDSSNRRHRSLFVETPRDLDPAPVVAAVVRPSDSSDWTGTDESATSTLTRVAAMETGEGVETLVIRRPAPWWITVVGLVVMGGLIGLSRRFGWPGSPLAE